jgi:hypothetical protein
LDKKRHIACGWANARTPSGSAFIPDDKALVGRRPVAIHVAVQISGTLEQSPRPHGLPRRSKPRNDEVTADLHPHT